MNVVLHDWSKRYDYRDAWLIHEIWMLGCMIVHKDMNIELHDYSWDMNVGLHNWFMRYECWNEWLFDYHMLFIKTYFISLQYVLVGLGMMLWYQHD